MIDVTKFIAIHRVIFDFTMTVFGRPKLDEKCCSTSTRLYILLENTMKDPKVEMCRVGTPFTVEICPLENNDVDSNMCHISNAILLSLWCHSFPENLLLPFTHEYNCLKKLLLYLTLRNGAFSSIGYPNLLWLL